MSLGLVGLALLMFLVTYPSRALPLLVPGIDRLPAPALAYLRYVGPAVLAALAAVNLLVTTEEGTVSGVRLGIEVVAVLTCVAVVAWRRNLFLGLATALVMVASVRALG